MKNILQQCVITKNFKPKTMTKTEIIIETKEFYEKNPKELRAIEKGTCAYNTENGNHCALGRCLLPKYHKLGTELDNNEGDILALVVAYSDKEYEEEDEEINLDFMLQKKYKGHSFNFWTNLQVFHDMKTNWDDKGLSSAGKSNYLKLLKKYKNQ